MKNSQPNQKSIAIYTNNLATNNYNKKPNNVIRIFKTTVLFVFAISFILSTTSCSKNVGSGCGTWQVAKYKKSNEFNSYRKYN